MKGDEKVIDFLNEALKNELTAINQYWLHYRMLDNWGVARLAEYERSESIDEMKHADRLAERILFLEREVGLQDLLDGLADAQAAEHLEIGQAAQKQDAVGQLVGVLHLVDRFVALVLGEPGHAPVVEHAVVQPVLVDRGHLVPQALVEIFDNLGIALHDALHFHPG